MKSLKLKMQDGINQGFSVQKLIAPTKPTKLAYKILINKNATGSQESRKIGKGCHSHTNFSCTILSKRERCIEVNPT